MDFPFSYFDFGFFRGYSTAEVQRPSKPTIAGSNPAARSNSARTFSTDDDGARDAQRNGCI